MTSSNGFFAALLAICAGNSPVPVNSPHKGQWRGVLMFSLIFVWINGLVNNHEAGDLRHYRVHCDVIVMNMYIYWERFVCVFVNIYQYIHQFAPILYSPRGTFHLPGQYLMIDNMTKNRTLHALYFIICLNKMFNKDLSCHDAHVTSLHCDILTLKWLGHFFQNVISFSDDVQFMCNIFIWNWSNTMDVLVSIVDTAVLVL